MQKKENLLIDCRPNAQYNIVGIKDFKNISLEEIISKDKEKDIKDLINHQDKDVYIMCRTGRTSKLATRHLVENNIKAFNIVGGIHEYAKNYDSDIPFIST
mmetsp:Transcript_29671/g.45639  ORF Transcript_29671/g.45639 Transcript_29671/m.45639 type:complete len:101 (+) Transcript_29671:59-361(+)